MVSYKKWKKIQATPSQSINQPLLNMGGRRFWSIFSYCKLVHCSDSMNAFFSFMTWKKSLRFFLMIFLIIKICCTELLAQVNSLHKRRILAVQILTGKISRRKTMPTSAKLSQKHSQKHRCSSPADPEEYLSSSLPSDRGSFLQLPPSTSMERSRSPSPSPAESKNTKSPCSRLVSSPTPSHKLRLGTI